VCVCVCLSVCVSNTLSVNSPTGQTPQQIFTVDSLKDADLRKDVPFGALDDEQSQLGVESPPKPQFLRPESSQTCEKFTQLYLQIYVSDWHEIWQGLRGWSRMVVKQFQDGGRPPFRKSIYRHISVKNHQIFMTWSKNEKVALDRLRVWLFHGRTGSGGRPSGWHDIVTCQLLVSSTESRMAE